MSFYAENTLSFNCLSGYKFAIWNSTKTKKKQKKQSYTKKFLMPQQSVLNNRDESIFLLQ